MTVKEGFLPVGLSNKNLDTAIIEQADGTKAHRESVVITDPENTDARVTIAKSKADHSEYALLAQHDTNSDEILTNILNEMRLLNMRFEEAFRTGISQGDI